MTGKAYAGLALVSLSTVMFELVLTRIWSVTMWYHFAFVAISVAMFGLTAGALAVYLLPEYFCLERTPSRLAWSATLFSASMVIAFLTQLCIPLIASRSLLGLFSAVLTYAVIAIPFCLSGVCIALALTKYPAQVSKLYAADLLGAAAGCLAPVLVLKFTDAPTAVVIAATLAGAGAILFALEARARRCLKLTICIALVFATFSGANTVLAGRQHTLLRLPWVRGNAETLPEYEKWNVFSRITVLGPEVAGEEPFGWGLSPAYRPQSKVKQRFLAIDGSAGTMLTGFSGDLEKVDFLKWDITNVAHYLRPDSRVLVIGAGGGRDILSALVFKQKSVVAVEINDIIVDILKRKYADFSGHLDRDPRVSLVPDEARSYTARQTGKFDIIQMALIDTGIASAAGAYALTENSLYTVEAWKLFLDRLSADGIITCTRWYYAGCPGEIYRMTAVARAALNECGVTDTRAHIAVLRHHLQDSASGCPDVGTILVSRSPFSQSDLALLESVAKDKQFELVLSPRSSVDENLSAIATGGDLTDVAGRLPIRISPATDDCPFFFYLIKPQDLLNPPTAKLGTGSFNTKAPVVLAQLLFVVVALTLLCIFLPLYLTRDRVKPSRDWPFLAYFAAIGLGFMFIEISQLERLIIFLGHPAYSLTVVLFTLLLASGTGSYLTNFSPMPDRKTAALCLAALLGALVIFALFAPHFLVRFAGATTSVRISLAVLMLAPLGLFMGSAFPLGLKLAADRCLPLAPWLWGVNGAASVCASVVAIAIAITAGISASYWTGFTCYLVALISLACISRETVQMSVSPAHQGEREQADGLARQTGTSTD